MNVALQSRSALRAFFRLTAIFCVALAVIAVDSRAHAQGSDVDNFVAYLDSTVRSFRANNNGNNANGEIARCRELMGRVLDIETMAQGAVGATWDRMSAAQRGAYRAAFEARMASECARSMRAFRSKSVLRAGLRQVAGGDRMLTTGFVLEPEGERMVTWRLRGAEKALRAVDVIADGRSVVATARNEFSAVLDSSNGSVDALIASMQR
jgi:ABC-type transporter MlaC component